MSPADRRRLLHTLDQIDRIRRHTTEGRAAYDDKTQDVALLLPPNAVRGRRNIIVHPLVDDPGGG